MIISNLPNQAPVDANKDYHFSKALRPFSLIIALVSTGLALARTHDHPDFSWPIAVSVILGALLAQSAVNLINDWTDRHQFSDTSLQAKLIKANANIAIIAFSLAGLIGVTIAFSRGLPIVFFAIAGFLACLAYTFEPVNLKRRGLGLFSVFIIMGPVLIVGSSYAMTGQWIYESIWDALLFSPLISLVLLANELRDHQRDSLTQDQTLTVRIGFNKARMFFLALLTLTVLGYCLAPVLNVLPASWLFIVPFVAAFLLGKNLITQSQRLIMPLDADHSAPQVEENNPLLSLPPLTGRLVFLTGAAHILSILEL